MRMKEWCPCRNLSVLSICIVSCSACLLYFFRLMFLVEEDTTFHILPDISIQDFLVNTSGCQIPAWDPWDDSVKVFYKPVSNYKCKGLPSFLRIHPNAVVTLDETLLQYYYEVDPQNVSCSFQEIHRGVSKVDHSIDNHITLTVSQNLTFNKPLGIDFIKTVCSFINSNQKLQVFNEFLPLTPLKTNVKYCTLLKQKLVNKPMNIIFLGLDSVSQLNFLRHFPNCKKFFSSDSSLFNMKGYTKVGDNTFPNIMPLLTGHYYQYYYDEVSNKTMFFDDVDFIWKIFSKIGYQTLFAEDAPDIATFNYYRSGFKKPPTDYYYRPFALSVEKSLVKMKSKAHCFGNKMEMQVIYDYFKSFIDTLGSECPFFAFIFLARLTHDVLNYAGYADEPTYHLLKYLDNAQVLNNSLLVFYSDHGIRYGSIRKTYIGQFEERMPFMNLYVPNWFLEKYKPFKRNLETNSRRLTTPFDIHATMLHLASIVSGNFTLHQFQERGISLFQEIPASRTCSQASITPHWCPCQGITLISKDDFLVQKAALTVISTINNHTSAYRKKCSLVTLDEILNARLMNIMSSRQSENVDNLPKNFNQSLKGHLLTISTVPSDAIFEATVYCEMTKGNNCFVVDDVSRINEYGKQSICIPDAKLRKFCYCIH